MNENLRGIVETTIAYELPTGEFKIGDTDLVAVNVYISHCIDGCCTEVTGRVIDSERRVAYEWDMLTDDPEKAAVIEKFMTENNLVPAMYITADAQTTLSDGINDVLFSIAKGMGRAAAEPVEYTDMSGAMVGLLKQLFGEDVLANFPKLGDDVPVETQVSESPVPRETVSSEN